MSSYLSKEVIRTIAPVVANLGLHHVAKPILGGLGHILMFHRILPQSNRCRIHNHRSIEITPEHFEKTIIYFKKRDYKFISLDTLYTYFINGTFSKKVLAITFDDGYIDNFTIAYPILKKYQIPFTIYVTTGIPNNTAILWWYLLEELIRDNEKINFIWKKQSYNFHCSSIPQKEKVYSSIQSFLHKNFCTESFDKLLFALFKKPTNELQLYTVQNGMTWEHLIELSKDPLVTIGAHTVNHFPLTKLNSEDSRREIKKSKTELEHKLGQPIDHFAYPFGKLIHANDRDYEIVKNLGFKTATTTEIGNLYYKSRTLLNYLPRININSVTDKNVLKLQTSGFLPFIINKGKIYGK